MKTLICGKEVTVTGKLFRTARLRHEWCDFVEDPAEAIRGLRRTRAFVDLFTFVNEVGSENARYRFYNELVDLAILPVTTYQEWWDGIGFKTRNKLRKGQKSGVDIRVAALNDDFARGVEAIY